MSQQITPRNRCNFGAAPYMRKGRWELLDNQKILWKIIIKATIIPTEIMETTTITEIKIERSTKRKMAMETIMRMETKINKD